MAITRRQALVSAGAAALASSLPKPAIAAKEPIMIGYLPAQVLRRDPRTAKLHVQLDEIDVETKLLATQNAALMRDIEALRNDVGAIEDRARADLGMVYPDEVVLRVVAPPELP